MQTKNYNGLNNDNKNVFDSTSASSNVDESEKEKIYNNFGVDNTTEIKLSNHINKGDFILDKLKLELNSILDKSKKEINVNNLAKNIITSMIDNSFRE